MMYYRLSARTSVVNSATQFSCSHKQMSPVSSHGPQHVSAALSYTPRGHVRSSCHLGASGRAVGTASSSMACTAGDSVAGDDWQPAPSCVSARYERSSVVAAVDDKGHYYERSSTKRHTSCRMIMPVACSQACQHSLCTVAAGSGQPMICCYLTHARSSTLAPTLCTRATNIGADAEHCARKSHGTRISRAHSPFLQQSFRPSSLHSPGTTTQNQLRRTTAIWSTPTGPLKAGLAPCARQETTRTTPATASLGSRCKTPSCRVRSNTTLHMPSASHHCAKPTAHALGSDFYSREDPKHTTRSEKAHIH